MSANGWQLKEFEKGLCLEDNNLTVKDGLKMHLWI